jgi:hypothetical protein
MVILLQGEASEAAMKRPVVRQANLVPAYALLA